MFAKAYLQGKLEITSMFITGALGIVNYGKYLPENPVQSIKMMMQSFTCDVEKYLVIKREL